MSSFHLFKTDNGNNLWFDPEDPIKNLVGARVGKGEWTVIFHAISLLKGLLTDLKRDKSLGYSKAVFVHRSPTHTLDRKSILRQEHTNGSGKLKEQLETIIKIPMVRYLCFYMLKYCVCPIFMKM